ncbi:MAG: PSD1 domain-containing protein [Bryobacterales bacterium]|nr:PSD1 domain-containing protein [Bryobacterales bacterium]
MRFELLLLISAFACLAPAQSVSFNNDVRPVLAARCDACHSERNASGGLVLTTFAGLRKGGASGALFVAGDPSQGTLLRSVTGDPPRMPKAGAPLTPQQTSLIRKWIEQGAKDDSAGGVQELWWSQRPLRKPPLPATRVSHPVDAFLEQKLQEKKLTPSAEAGRRVLIRRLSYDLIGLPPSIEEIRAFETDRSADAYTKLVDRLLASPRYGERWARHWLDVAHYGDSHGYDKDKPRANAWPYRDYVIRAFNNDKPYAQFIREQIAGDVLDPANPDAIVATGFLAAGPWDFVGHQELREDTTDKNITRLLDRDDMVAATMSTFVSQTVHCARCHNHKFDPISQEDYYSVQAVFAGVDRADRPYDADPEVSRQRNAWMDARRKLQIELQPLLDRVETATSPELEKLDFEIRDARAQVTHIGEPKTPAEAALKKELQQRAEHGTKRRKELVDAIVGDSTLHRIQELTAAAKLLDQQMAELPKPGMVYAATSYFPRMGTFRPSLLPRPVHVLDRGNVNAPLKPAQPGAIGTRFAIADPMSEGSRRAALAEWIARPDNSFTWRSIVNRVWHYHFGSGIVDTPSDFGKMGSQPTHPQLLDWLAVWFRDEAGGSLKQLHRLIVTSHAYRQTSANRADAAAVDGENRYLWRMNRTRLDAESLRDSMLVAAGQLDLTMGGPAVRQFFFKDDHSPVYDYARFDPDSPEARRRSIYRFIVRSVPDPFMDRLDCPDPSMLAPKRSTTITAIQALAILNNPFVVKMAERFAARVGEGGTVEAQIHRAFGLAFGRDATAAEVAQLAPYAQRHGMANLCRLLFNLNEYMFVD